MDTSKHAIFRKINWHVIPLIVAGYVMAFLDRVNISFASLTMNGDLGFSATLYGWGAGIFFFSYFAFEVPSNVLLAKYGARRWLARILISWGIVSAGMAFVTGPISFLTLRFLLGAMEAGFFPGVLLYLTYWYPKEYRARITAAFLVAVPVSVVVGAPLSTAILGFDGLWGLKGWQLVFIFEALPSILLGFVYWAYLIDKPEDAKWLTPTEKTYLHNVLRAEAAEVSTQSGAHDSALSGMKDPRILMLGGLYFCSSIAFYGLSFWLPQVLRQLGVAPSTVGWLLTIPYGLATVAMIAWSKHSDKTGERPRHLFIAAMIAAAGLAATGLTSTAMSSVIAITVAAVGLYMLLPIFWSYPSGVVTGKSAASGLALINSIGALAGFVGPFFIGLIKDTTGGYTLSFYLMAGFLVLEAFLGFYLGKRIFGRAANHQSVSTASA